MNNYKTIEITVFFSEYSDLVYVCVCVCVCVHYIIDPKLFFECKFNLI